MAAAGVPHGTLHLLQVGARVELAVRVPVGGGAASYGMVEADAQQLRELLKRLRVALWGLERAGGVPPRAGQTDEPGAMTPPGPDAA